MTLPRCACGFVMPSPRHANHCNLYDAEKIYGDRAKEMSTPIDVPAIAKAHHERLAQRLSMLDAAKLAELPTENLEAAARALRMEVGE